MVNINRLNSGNITVTLGSSSNNHENEFMLKSTNDGLSGEYSSYPNFGQDSINNQEIRIYDEGHSSDFSWDTWYPVGTQILLPDEAYWGQVNLVDNASQTNNWEFIKTDNILYGDVY